MEQKERIVNALRIAFDAAGGDMSQVDPSYLEVLDCTYSDGDVCSISSFSDNISPFESFEAFIEHVDPLIKGSPDGAFGSLPLTFAEDASEEEQLKQIIGTVYLDGVANVSDINKKRLSEANNYGFNTDKGSWEGYFQSEDGTVFKYEISKNSAGKWTIEYKVESE